MIGNSAGNGQFTLPASPTAGTAVAQSGSANTYGSYVAITSSVGNTGFITGLRFSLVSTSKPTYLSVQIGTGGAGVESTVGQIDCPIIFTAGGTGSQLGGRVNLDRPIPVTSGTRIAAKTASDVASALSWNITLEYEKKSDLADVGINESADMQAIFGSATAAQNAKNFWAGLSVGTATAGTSTTITLAVGSSSSDSFYNNATISIVSGTGAGQTREITGYVGSTRVATVDTAWVTAPDNTSVYQIIGRIV